MGHNGDMNCPSSAMNNTNMIDPFYCSNWDPIVHQPENFGAVSLVSPCGFSNSPYQVVMENQGSSGTSHMVHYGPDSGYNELDPKLTSFVTGGFSDIVGSFGLHQNIGVISESNSKNGNQSQENEASPNGKRRKRAPESCDLFDPNKNAEGEQQKASSGESYGVQREHDLKKPKYDQNGKQQSSKQTKESCNSEEAPKDNYIHVRARRGQATNSHSLAERVRREKISERMRLLQDLVPGCNKITGKAVMLDEIINYVQSLQQQVEFLSMKLATVNPELNIDIERILTNDILHARGANTSVLGLSQVSQTHSYQHGVLHGTMNPAISTPNHQFSSVPCTLIDNDLRDFFHLGYDSSSIIGNIGSNGNLKSEV